MSYTRPDGTVMEDDELADVLGTIPELQKRISNLKRTLREIEHLAIAPHWDSKRRWKIAEIAKTAAAVEEQGE